MKWHIELSNGFVELKDTTTPKPRSIILDGREKPFSSQEAAELAEQFKTLAIILRKEGK